MELKFLFGFVRAIEKGDLPSLQTSKTVNAMVVSRRTHTLQHLDMKRKVNMGPTAGGFIKRPRKTTLFHWYGESESCQVNTDGSLDKIYRTLVTVENIYKVSLDAYGQPHNVYMFLPEGKYPCNLVTELAWEKVEDWEAALEELQAEDSCYTR